MEWGAKGSIVMEGGSVSQESLGRALRLLKKGQDTQQFFNRRQTMFGLPVQEFKKLAVAMVTGKPSEEGPPPPNQLSKQWSLVPPVVADGVPSGGSRGRSTL